MHYSQLSTWHLQLDTPQASQGHCTCPSSYISNLRPSHRHLPRPHLLSLSYQILIISPLCACSPLIYWPTDLVQDILQKPHSWVQTTPSHLCSPWIQPLHSLQRLFGYARSEVQHARSVSLTRDWTPAPLHWKHGVLATGPQGSHSMFNFLRNLQTFHSSWNSTIFHSTVLHSQQPWVKTQISSHSHQHFFTLLLSPLSSLLVLLLQASCWMWSDPSLWFPFP